MLTFSTWDVFTDAPYTGNPLAIVRGADGLSTAQMQTIAREFNLSETIFVQTPADAAHSARVRIFFPAAEIPFAGHPTIGCAIALATEEMAPDQNTHQITLEEQAGLVPVEVVRSKTGLTATLTAPVVPYQLRTMVPQDLAAPALGLDTEAITGPCAVHQGGPEFLYVPLKDTDALSRATVTNPQFDQLTGAAGTRGVYLYAAIADGYSARMFAPAGGIPEDPATGSASAILASQLLATGHLGEGTTALTLRQGIDMGRPSTIGFAADVAHGELAAVRISGQAVPISRGQISPPV